MDIYTIRRRMGHTSPVTTGRYMHVTAGHPATIKSPLEGVRRRAPCAAPSGAGRAAHYGLPHFRAGRPPAPLRRARRRGAAVQLLPRPALPHLPDPAQAALAGTAPRGRNRISEARPRGVRPDRKPRSIPIARGRPPRLRSTRFIPCAAKLRLTVYSLLCVNLRGQDHRSLPSCAKSVSASHSKVSP